MNIKTVVLSLIMLIPVSASGEIPIGQYAQLKDNDQVKTYITGVGKGVFYADVYLSVFDRKPLLCIPPGVEIGQDIILAAIEKELNTTNYDPLDPVESIVPMALMVRFPCPN